LLPLASLLGIRKTDLAHRSCSFAGSVLHARNVLLIRCSLTPTLAMRDALRADYVAMVGMIFGDVPPLDTVLASIEEFERRVNE
ncbi:hypothetical protein ACSFA8_22390, partial [Variovorax sp. RT4R15]